MAENKSSSNKQQNTRTLNNLLTKLDKQTDDLFSSAYKSSTANKKMFDDTMDDLSKAIKTAIGGDNVSQIMFNTSKLYEKIYKDPKSVNNSDLFLSKSVNSDDPSSITDLFNDNEMLTNIANTYADTKWLEQIDNEIDMILKYMPKLQTALNLKKSNVLSADNFSKGFLNATLENMNNDNSEKEKFVTNFNFIKDNYNIEKKIEQWYTDTSKYGEVFVYRVPYQKALSELIKRKNGTGYQLREFAVTEKGVFDRNNDKINIVAESHNGGLSLRLSKIGIVEECVLNANKYRENVTNKICKSLYESFIEETSNPKNIKISSVSLNRTIPDELEYEDNNFSNSRKGSEGLISPIEDAKKIKSINGCIISTLPRSRVIPIYLDDDNFCLGYYYIRLNNTQNLVDANIKAINNGYNSITSMLSSTILKADEGDMMLRRISADIARHIDSNFINSNQDLKKEIYGMLKYNDTYNQLSGSVDMDVTFIPPEDITHWRFNIDKRSHRGISDLWDSLIPAKMWIMITTTTALGQAIRGQDKRVYYVKNMVDTNVARNLLNVVSQIKKGNFGLRQMESINNILQITGKFNDFVIPVGPSGDPPITFDIMQGQQFDLPQDLVQNLEESAVNNTGVPIEIVNSSANMDFAIRYTMTNIKLLSDTVARQADVQRFMNDILTTIYNCEFGGNVKVKTTLPPPTFLVLTQGTQLIQNGTQYIDALSEVAMAGEPDEDRNEFRKLMLAELLPTYINIDLINKVKQEIKINKSVKKSEPGDEDNNEY